MAYTYNNVTLQLLRTLEFSMEPGYDPSHTDVMYQVYTIRVRGFVSGSVGQFRTDTPTALNELKDALETPRRPFSYSIGGVTLVSVNPTGLGVNLDAALGPHPLPATVREVTSGTFMVECGVVCRVVSCDSSCGGALDPVLSLRWSQTESFDQNWFSHLTTSGKLIVRSDLLQSADSFRPLATPPLLTDYIRTTAKYTLSYDGLQLDFHFDDVEKDRLPPSPATKASGRFTVICEKNVMRIGQVDIHLQGPKGTDRRLLMLRAISMAYAKIQMENPYAVGGLPIVSGTFREDLFDPAVDVSIQSRLMSLNGGVFYRTALGLANNGIVGAALGAAAVIPGPVAIPSVGRTDGMGIGQGAPGIAPPDRKRLAALLAAAFRDPCACLTANAELSTTGTQPTFDRLLPSIPLNGNIPATITTGSTPPIVTNLVNDGAPYDTYQIETSSTFDSGKVQMPGTGVGANGANGSIAQVHGGLTQLVTTWVAGRTGKPPVLPAFLTTDPNMVPLSGALVASATVPNADGSALVYMTSGYYVYAIVNPNLFNLVASVPPFLTTEVKTGAQQGDGFWSNLYNFQGANGANPFVAGGSVNDTPPPVPLGFDNLPLSGLPIGGFQDLGNPSFNFDPDPAFAFPRADDDLRNDPFFNPPSIGP